jgi:hypothetical protein
MKYSLDELKKQPYFKISDIIVYVLILITALAIVFAVLIPKSDRTLDKINIYYNDTLIYVYDFTSSQGEKVKGYESYIVEKKDTDKTVVEIKTKDGENIIEIGQFYEKMAKANCSTFADCVRSFRPITEGGDIIICLPNKIKIIGEGKILQNEVRL